MSKRPKINKSVAETNDRPTGTNKPLSYFSHNSQCNISEALRKVLEYLKLRGFSFKYDNQALLPTAGLYLNGASVAIGKICLIANQIWVIFPDSVHEILFRINQITPEFSDNQSLNCLYLLFTNNLVDYLAMSGLRVTGYHDSICLDLSQVNNQSKDGATDA